MAPMAAPTAAPITAPLPLPDSIGGVGSPNDEAGGTVGDDKSRGGTRSGGIAVAAGVNGDTGAWGISRFRRAIVAALEQL